MIAPEAIQYHTTHGYTGLYEAVWQNNMQSMRIDMGNGFEWSRFKLRISLYTCLWYPASTEQLIASGNHSVPYTMFGLMDDAAIRSLYLLVFKPQAFSSDIMQPSFTLPSMYVFAMYTNIRNSNTLMRTCKFSLFRRQINTVFTPTSHGHFVISCYILECEDKTKQYFKPYEISLSAIQK